MGEQGADIARVAALNADYAETTAGVQIDRFCASGLEACNMAAAKVMTGEADMAVGGGVESMSRVPDGRVRRRLVGPIRRWPSRPISRRRGSAPTRSPRNTASRAMMSTPMRWKASARGQAWKEGRFKNSVIAVKDQMGGTHSRP